MSRFYPHLALGLCVLLAQGCLPSEESPSPALSLRVAPGDPIVGPFLDGETPRVQLDLGDVFVGATGGGVVILGNVGDANLQLEDLELSSSDPCLWVDSPPSLPHTVRPGEELELRVTYEPRSDGSCADTLFITTNAPEYPLAQVQLRAEGLGPSITLTPETVNFGSVPVGCASPATVEIRNEGRAPLTLGTISYEQTTGNGELWVATQASAGDVLAPGETVTATVTYAPNDLLPDLGELRVATDDPERPEAIATQSGAASPHDEVIDTFEITKQVDFLWVVDVSSGMPWFQEAIAAELGSFLSVLYAFDADFQIGVTTASLADQGELRGVVPIVTRYTPHAADELAANLVAGFTGATPRAFDAAILALTPPNTDPGGANEGFLRPAADRLAIIFLTDKSEQSSQFASLADYVAFFQGLKPNPPSVTLSNLSGGLTGCSVPGAIAAAGVSFVQASLDAGGVSASICDPDVASSLEQIAGLGVQASDTFRLSRDPVPQTLVVRISVDGGPYDPVNSGWVYDASTNAVIFDASSVPEDGWTVQLDYLAYGGCAGPVQD